MKSNYTLLIEKGDYNFAMKKYYLLLIVMFLSIIACQPTPQEEVVSRKNLDLMIEAASSKDKTMSLSDIDDEIYYYSYVDERDTLRIDVEAPIILPNVDKVPLIEIKRHEWTEDDLKNCFLALCPGQMMIERDMFPKAFYQKTLDELLGLLNEGKLDKYDSQEDLEQAIRLQMELVENAPASPKMIPANFTFKVDTLDGELRKTAEFFSTESGDSISWLTAICSGIETRIVYRRDIQTIDNYDQYLMDNREYIAMRYSDNNTTLVPPSIAQDEALTIATRTVYRIDPSLSCSAVRLAPINYIEANKMKCVYECIFTRETLGVNALYTNYLVAMPESISDVVAPPWWYESIRCFIDEDGIAFLIWNAPYEIIETIETDTQILPFNTIRANFERIMPIKYTTLSTEQSNEIMIDRVCLGLCRIIEQNDNSIGLLVPTWFFFGKHSIKSKEYVFTYGNDGYECILMINAVDGSIINPVLGY